MRRRIILVLAILLVSVFTLTSVSMAAKEDIPPLIITPSTLPKPITEDFTLCFLYEDSFMMNDLEY